MSFNTTIGKHAFGPLMIDIEGTELSETERSWLADWRVGGVILFTRNFDSREQIANLVASIRTASESPLLIAIDHEGGRVQRFRDGFSAIPPMRKLGELYDRSPAEAEQAARILGGVLAAELAAIDIDFSFTPVVDVDTGNSGVIGDRAFHGSPQIISRLAKSLMEGLHQAGMAAVAKHFPGHGFVAADSHLELPVDPRTLEAIREQDLLPFRELAEAGVEGVMPAHVVYENIDPLPAGFSAFWIGRILRRECGFDGAVFSDDLSMQGAVSMGSSLQRARLALEAGCDMLLVCNDHSAVAEILEGIDVQADEQRTARLAKLQRRDSSGISTFRVSAAQGFADTISALA
ncbi:MAG: beta-N-acetylhexosaminidase [Gammaproteobacteria bacterium]|nr:beta-N-acetylhexosaminidase [Gammaproteobacteria bacterium]